MYNFLKKLKAIIKKVHNIPNTCINALKLSNLPFLGSCTIHFKICCTFMCLFFTMQLRITCFLVEFPLGMNLFDWTDGERKS